jgi:hydroxypyruvate isomerase
MYQLSVCADTVFLDLPFERRVEEIARAGFLVEFWWWEDRDIDALATHSDIQLSAFTGYTPGSMVHPDTLEMFLEGVEKSLTIADKLQCRQLFLSTGLTHQGQVFQPIASHPATLWITAYKGLSRVAELAEKHDVVYHLEPLNTRVDHPGYPLSRVEDAVRLIEAVGSPRIKLLLDIYHVQIEEGNVIQAIRDYADYLGYVHVADVPGRHEPGTGEINYPRVAQALREVGYEGVIGLEAFPLSDDYQALKRFKEAFTAQLALN